MINFKAIESLLSMDFSAMRGLPCNDGDDRRATDEGILYFVGQLNMFFDQFKKSEPNLHQIEVYLALMDRIITKINKAEYAYYLSKYGSSVVDTEMVNIMAQSNLLKSYKKLPVRMQFWAAGESFGDTIRNAAAHRQAVKHLERWEKYCSKKSEHASADSTFVSPGL